MGIRHAGLKPRNFIFHRQVSLLRSFTDISENPLDWTPGVHGNLDEMVL